MYREEELENLTMEKIYQAQQNQMGNQMNPQMDYGPQEYIEYGPYAPQMMQQQMEYQMQQMTVPCATVTVVAPALITATNIVTTPSGTCTAPCNVSIDVTWINQGGTSGTFTPAITVNGGAPQTLPAVTLAPGANITKTWPLAGLQPGSYTICPVPN